MDNEKIPLKEKLLYGFGEFYGTGCHAVIGAILFVFMTKSLKIGPAIASTIILVSKLWDAVSDPLMGVISDNTRTRFGRRRVWLVAGGALIPFTFMLLFAPVQNMATVGKTVLVTFAYLFTNTVTTVTQVPYNTLTNEISPDFIERNKANKIKLLFAMAAGAVCYLVPNLVFNSHLNYLEGKGGVSSVAFFLICGLGFGIVFTLSTILCGLFTKERVPYNKDIKSKFSWKSFIAPIKIKSYRYLLIMYVTAFLCMDLLTAVLVYYARDVMQGVVLPLFNTGLEFQSVYLIAPLMVMVAAMYPFVMRAMKKKSKQFAFRMCIPCYILGAVALSVFPAVRHSSGANWLLVVFASLMGVGFGGAQMMPWLIFPDAVDVAELKTGVKDTGAYSGLMTFVRKFSTAFAIWIVGISMELAGYDKNIPIQPLETSKGLFITVRVIIAVAIAIFMSIAFFASLKYKVTDKKLARVKYFLDIDRSGAAANLTEEEKAEKQALIDELA